MHHHVTQLRDLPVWSNFLTTANFRRVDYVTKLLTCMFLVSKCSIQSYFDVFLLEHPWQRQFPVLVPRRYDVMPSDDVMILAPARLWRHTFRAVFSCSFLPKEFICFVFTTWLCEQHSHIVWMVPCQVNRCFIIQYIRFNIKGVVWWHSFYFLKSTIVRYFVRSTANLLSVVFQQKIDMF